MLIVCPNCATSYRIDTSSLGASGRSVRCVRCRNVWFASDPSAPAASAPDHGAEMTTVAADDAAVTAAPSPDTGAADGPMSHESVAELQPELQDVASDPAIAAGWPDEHPLPQIHAPIAMADAPALAPMEHSSSLPADAALGEDIETFAARRAPRAKRRNRFSLPFLPLAILALIALNAALIGWRADVVRVAPQTASLYAAIGLPVNLRGLSFADVSTATETHDGVQVLVVEGTVASASPRLVEVPRLRFSVRNAAGQEVYAWTALPTRNILAPGETLAFRSRLASPPPDARDVLVRFFNRRDLVAGVQ